MTVIPLTQPIVYREPTYHLHLTPEQAPKAFHFKSLAQKTFPYQSLDHLVDQVMQNRYGDELQGFSKGKLKKLRKEVAYSLMERPDQKSSLKIQLPLAEAQGLTKNIEKRLQKMMKDHLKKPNLTPIITLIFSNCKEENFGLILSAQLTTLFGRAPESKPLCEAVFKEVCKIRDELDELTRGTMKFYRPPQSTDGESYINHRGETVTLAQTIPSSFDRAHPDVQNGRFNLDSKGHVIYSAGRIETERKANQVLYRMVHQTFLSGQLKKEDLAPQADGSYLYPVVIENLINATPSARKEREYLLQEDEVLKSLSGSNITITLPSGEQVVVKLMLMHFSTQTNYNVFLGQRHAWSSTGSDVAEQITREGAAALETYFNARKSALPESTQKAVEYCLKELNTCTRLRDRLILRAFICELLNIPYHVHCKSSKDRTAVVAAIKKALHLWLKVETWKTEGGPQIPDPRELFNNTVFREYSEAAFFENLPLTDQGVGMSGVLDGKLYTQDRGFNYQFSIFEHHLPAYVLSDRHLYTASIIERLLYAGMMPIASLVLGLLYVALLPIVLGIMYYKYKEDFWEATKYTFLLFTALPIRSGFRRQWIDRNSPTLKERSFLLKHHPKEKVPSPSKHSILTLTQLNQAVDHLSSEQYNKILQFLQSNDPHIIKVKKMHQGSLEDAPDATIAYILKEIGNHWEELKKEKTSGRLKALMEAAQASDIALFQLLQQITSDGVTRFIQEIDLKHATDELLPTLIREKAEPTQGFAMTQQFVKDYCRTNIVVKTPQGEIPFMSHHRSLTSLPKFHQALKKIPLLKNETQIPLAIEEMLTQKTTLFTSLVNYISTIDSSINIRQADPRIFFLQQGENSTLVLSLYETLPLYSSTDPTKRVGTFHYRCDFILDKGQDWKVVSSDVSQAQFKWDDVSERLTRSNSLESTSSMIRKTKFSHNIELIRKYVEAIALYTDEDLVDFKELSDNILPLIQALLECNLSLDELRMTELEYNMGLMITAFEKCRDLKNQLVIQDITREVLNSINKEYVDKLFEQKKDSKLIKELAATKI